MSNDVLIGPVLVAATERGRPSASGSPRVRLHTTTGHVYQTADDGAVVCEVEGREMFGVPLMLRLDGSGRVRRIARAGHNHNQSVLY